MTEILSLNNCNDFSSGLHLTDNISISTIRTPHSDISAEIYNNAETKASTCLNQYSFNEINSISKSKIILKIEHYITKENEYICSRVLYRYAYSKVIRYENSTSSIIKETYYSRKTSYKGIPIEIICCTEKHWTPSSAKSNRTYIRGNITLNLTEPHYSLNIEDKEYFRKRTCRFDSTKIPANIRWIQKINRPARYEECIDSKYVGYENFDSNTILVYLNQKKMSEKLNKLIIQINGAKSRSFDKVSNSQGTVKVSLKTEMLSKFVDILFDYTIKLLYINTSYGWNFKSIDYECVWNTALYILQTIKPFKDDIDWIEGVKSDWIKFKLSKKLYNECQKGLDKYLIESAKVNNWALRGNISIYKFPEDMCEEEKIKFKKENPSRCQVKKEDKIKLKEETKKQKIQEKEDKIKLKEETKKQKIQEKEDKIKKINKRNKEIKKLYKQGKSVKDLSVKYKLSTKQIRRIIAE